MTQAQVRAMGVTILQGLGLQPQLWPVNGVGSTLLTYSAQIIANLSSSLSTAIGQQWLPTAFGGGLQLLSKYFYGVSVPQATFASGNLLLTNTGGGVYTYQPFTAVFASTVANASGVFPTYQNTTLFTLNASSSLSIPVQCTIVGTAGNAAPGVVTKLVTSMLGVTSTNPLSITGQDVLSDAALRNLDLASIAARSVFGPTGAYIFAIQTAINSVTGAPVNINRWTFVLAPLGVLTVYLASPSGAPSATDVIGATNSIIANALTLGVTLGVQPAIAVPYTPTLSPTVQAPLGTSPTAVQQTIATAISNYLASTANPIGGTTAFDPGTGGLFTGLQGQTIFGQAASAVSTNFPGATLLSMAGLIDLALTPVGVATDGVTVNLPVMLAS